MPRYSYKCSDCNEVVEVWHSITEKLENCQACNKEHCMEKIPSNFSLAFNKENSKSSSRPGDLVKQSIEEFKQDLKQQKKDMINQEVNK